MVDFTCKFPFRVFKFQISISGIFAHFVCKGGFGQIRVKITERSIRFENFYFGSRFTNYGVYFKYKFCSF